MYTAYFIWNVIDNPLSVIHKLLDVRACIHSEDKNKNINLTECSAEMVQCRIPCRSSVTFLVRPKKVRFLVSARVFFCCCCYETMSNCSQNCQIDWNFAVLCFKWLFHIGVWTFARFVRPLLATILYIWEIWSPRIQCITYFPVGKKQQQQQQKTRHRIDFEADRWPETGDFFWP